MSDLSHPEITNGAFMKNRCMPKLSTKGPSSRFSEAKEDMLSLQGTTQLSAMSYHHKNVKPKNQKNGISNNKQHSSRSKTTGKYKDFTAM